MCNKPPFVTILDQFITNYFCNVKYPADILAEPLNENIITLQLNLSRFKWISEIMISDEAGEGTSVVSGTDLLMVCTSM